MFHEVNLLPKFRPIRLENPKEKKGMSEKTSTNRKRDDIVIHVRKATKAKFVKFGKWGETQDKLLFRMCKHIDSCDRWWFKYG